MPEHDTTSQPAKAWVWLLRGLAVAALALVFALYMSPHFVVDMAARLWSCI